MAEGVRTAVIVDDDPDIRRMLKLALEMAGFVTFEAGTGHDGVAMIQKHMPDLITLDLVLPGLGGVEVCRRARTMTDAYIIMITSSSDETDRLVGLATGADDYITKPFNPREVQARVAAMFRRPRAAAAPAEVPMANAMGAAAGVGAADLARDRQSAYLPSIPAPSLPDPPAQNPYAPAQPAQAGPGPAGGNWPQPGLPGPRQGHADSMLQHGVLVVDSEGRTAQYGGTDLPLTKIEFDLLATMMRHPRRAWTRELLLEQVWGSQWSDHHVVEVHIGNLRRKLSQAAPNREIIQTVRGVGYRLAPPA